jgi:hypothetical protein
MPNITGTFSAAGQSASFTPRVGERIAQSGQFNVALTGTGVGAVQLERSFDNGATWCPLLAGGVQLYQWSYAGANLSETVEECEAGVLYRLNDTAHTSGSIAYRLSPGA